MRALLAVLTAFTSPAWAARPFVTDDARVVDEGHCQIETFYKDQRTYTGSEFWFIPACNPHGLEVSIGINRVENEGNGNLQAKYLFKELQPNGYGLAAAVGSYSGQPYFNAIASVSFFDDRAVVHANLGRLNEAGKTWGVGLEALLFAPRIYGIAETYGQRGETPTWHYGIRYWITPGRLQFDATRADQGGDPERRFYTLGLRFIF
jgi:hypothetical protein